MYCKAEPVVKNLCYRILTIQGKYYILDVDKPFFVYFFPFIFWLLPHRVYEIDEKTFEELKVNKVPRNKSFLYAGLLGVGVGYPVAQLVIKPMLNYFQIPMGLPLKILILVFTVIILLSVRVKVSRVGKEHISGIVNLNKMMHRKIRIWPKSIGYVLKLPLFGYLLFATISYFLVYIFILSGNFMFMFFFAFILFLNLMINSLVVLNGAFGIRFLPK